MPQHGEVDGAAEARLEDVGRDSTIEGLDLAIVVEIPAGDGDVPEEVGSKGDIGGRDHQHHLDVFQRLEGSRSNRAGNESVLALT